MQIRAQEALAVTEDVINIKDNKFKMKEAIENGDLPSAVNYIREVHDIGLDSAGKSSPVGHFFVSRFLCMYTYVHVCTYVYVYMHMVNVTHSHYLYCRCL